MKGLIERLRKMGRNGFEACAEAADALERAEALAEAVKDVRELIAAGDFDRFVDVDNGGPGESWPGQTKAMGDAEEKLRCALTAYRSAP